MKWKDRILEIICCLALVGMLFPIILLAVEPPVNFIMIGGLTGCLLLIGACEAWDKWRKR